MTTFEIPDAVPVMPLPGVAMFPNCVMPLRIFEPRYRKMLDHALGGDRMICMAQMKPAVTEAKADDDFFHTAGVGIIRASVTLPDGTSNVMLQGVGRIRITDFAQRKPFRIATCMALRDELTHAEDIEKRTAEVQRLLMRALESGTPPPPDVVEQIVPVTPSSHLADLIAQHFLTDAAQRQTLMEETNVAVRIRTLEEYLRGMLKSPSP